MKRQRARINYRQFDDSDMQLEENKPRKPLENTLEAEVLEGDTLASIALRFNCTVADLKRLNKIDKDNEIFAHKTLKIPLTPHNVLLDTSPLPSVHKSGNNSPKASTSRDISENVLSDEKLEEKLIVASISNSIYKGENPTVNSSSHPNQVADYLDDENVVAASVSYAHSIRQPKVILAKPRMDFSFNGSDCDINWICLLICILLLCFIIPVIYVLYTGEKKIHPEWFVTESPKPINHLDT